MNRTALFLTALVICTTSSRAAEPPETAAQVKTLSPEKIFETKFEGQATVEIQVGQVTVINIDSRAVPGASHAHILEARLPQGQDDRRFLVILTREIVARFVQLGIDDLPEHVREKQLRVTGRVDRLEENRFRILITNLDQWESLRAPAAESGASPRQAEVPQNRAELDWLVAMLQSAPATQTSTSPESQESQTSIERILCGRWKGGPCMGSLNFAANGTFERKYYTPGGNQLGGTWRIRWDALPPTLVLTYNTSNDPVRFPAGKILELKVAQLDAQRFVYKYSGEHRAEYHRKTAAEETPK